MTEITTGIRSILASPVIYRAWGNLIGAPKARVDYLERYLRPKPGDRILDIGCGPATLLEVLPANIAYVGFDLSEEYIEAARRRYGDRGSFVHATVDEAPAIESSSFDIVSATGLLHHLDDHQALATFRLAYSSLKPGGRFITSDPALGITGQSPVAKWIIKRDRGQCVREPRQYRELAQRVFETVKGEMRNDRLNIPYTHFIMECHKALS